MKQLNQSYVSISTGGTDDRETIWDGATRAASWIPTAIIICHRYIECNPVSRRHGRGAEGLSLVRHRANAFGAEDKLLTPHPLVMALADGAEQRRVEYRRLFRFELDAETLGEIASGPMPVLAGRRGVSPRGLNRSRTNARSRAARAPVSKKINRV